LVALVAGAIVGARAALAGERAWLVGGTVRDRLLGSATPDPAPPVTSRVAGPATEDAAAAPATALRSEPWWQDVTSLDGTATTTSSPFEIGRDAIQWRVRWSCPTGHLMVRVPDQARPVVDADCGKGGTGYATRTGPLRLDVTAIGAWHLDVQQQIDTPLIEPSTPAMTAAGSTTVGTGSFYNIDKTGTGTVTIYHQVDGRYSLRLDDFFVSPNVDLQLRLSTLGAPHSSQEFNGAPSELVQTMDVTAGSLNYALPDGLDPTRFRSVVIWCPPVTSAYAAATLPKPR